MKRIASRLGDNTTTIALNNNILEDRKLQLEEQFREDIHKLIEETVPIDLPPFIDVNALQPTGTPNDIYYYHPNHLGSTSFVTDQNQTITQGFLYAPFGEITTEYAPLWQNGTLPKYSFNAKELDEETGMYYYEARYYAPPTFTSRDPLFEKYFWMSPYAYCANNPVKYVDPSGEEPDIFMFALTDKKYNTFLNGSKHIKERNDAFQVMAHGNPQLMRIVKNGKIVDGDNGKINSAEKFNEVFKNNEKWNNGKNTKGFSVILYSCNTGKGKNSLAHKLSAKYQNITVIAPSSKVWFSSNGLLGTYNTTNDGERDENDPGYWLVYQKGKVVSAYDATWIPGESTEGHQVDISKIPQDHLNGVSIGKKEKWKEDDKK